VADALYPWCAVAAWLAVGYRLAGLRRDPGNPALRAVCAALACVASATTFAVPAVGRVVDAVVGVPNLAILAAHVSIVLFTASVLRMLLHWSHPPAEARTRARRLVPVFAVTLATMVVLFILAPLEESTDSLAGRYATYPYVPQYLAVYLGAMSVGQAAIAFLGWSYARVAGRPWLRRGLRVTVAAAFAGMGFCLGKAVYVVGLHLDVRLPYVEAATPLLASTSALLLVAGLTAPGWGPRLADAGAWVRRYHSHRQLYPLWRELYRAVPQIALIPAPAGNWPARDLAFRLYRRVIEIRDGQLALRPYYDGAVARTARRLGAAAGLDGAALDATVAAAVIAAALRAMAGDEAGRPRPPDPDGAADTPGGKDLSGELAWLVPVARAFAGSPVVRAVLAGTAPAPVVVREPLPPAGFPFDGFPFARF
jgi:hypothetical protein